MKAGLPRSAGTRRCCPCGVLLGVVQNGALHLKYKEFRAIVRGQADVTCRVCGHVETVGCCL